MVRIPVPLPVTLHTWFHGLQLAFDEGFGFRFQVVICVLQLSAWQ
jgi:hypothetical protein